jgi:glycosyltransferase involved in cell wall biosynthesis
MSDRRTTSILFVHHRPELGGAPQSLAYLIRELDRERFDPHVYCPPGPAADLFRAAGAAVHPGPVASFTHIWASTYHGRRWLLLAREVARLEPHVRHLHRVLSENAIRLVHLNDSPPVAAAWVAHRAGIPVVWQLRSALPGGGRDARSRLIRRAIRGLSTATIAINEDVAASFAVDAAVVPNSVDLDRFRPGDRGAAREQLGLEASGPVVAFVGFVYPSKGYRQFIEAAAAVRRRGVSARYLVVGGAVRDDAYLHSSGGRILRAAGLVRDDEGEARALAAGLGLDGDLRFIPYVADPAGIYRAADLVVAPSQGPELGRSVIEAAASGVPVLATGSTTGAGIVVPGETGLLVEPTAEAIADAMAGLLADDELRSRIGRAARARAELAFDPKQNARTVERIYESALGR